jgi:hypothetical protein
METREQKTTAELESLAIEVIRRLQGCSGFGSLTIVPNEHLGWIIDSWDGGTANPADSTRAVAVTQIDLQAKYSLKTC